MRSFEFHPFLPAGQVLLLAAVAVGLSVWLQRLEGRRRGLGWVLFGIRTLAIAIVALLILNPVHIQAAEKAQGKTPVLVLVDTSHSMAVVDVNGKRRIDAVQDALLRPGFLDALAKDHAPTLFEFGGTSTRQSTEAMRRKLDPNGDRTFIGESLAGALSTVSNAPAGAVLILSDGRDQGEVAPTEVAKQAKARGFPVYTVCVGSATKTKDVAVAMNRPQIFTSPNQEVSVTADLSSSGFPDESIDVRLLREGKPTAAKTVTLRGESHTQVSFPLKEPAKGTFRYTIQAVPLPGEVTTANNRAASLVTVGNSITQVLVLEGKPSWDTKFMLQALRSDPSLSVDSIFQLAPERMFAVRGASGADESGQKAELKIPSKRAEFAKYDVVILGKGADKVLTPAAEKELQQYVSEDSGHIVFLRGQADPYSTALAKMEPVAWSDEEVHDLRIKVTSEGASNPAFEFGGSGAANVVIEKLPSLISATRVKSEKALSVVLARAQGANDASQPNREMAVIAYQRYGGGLALSLAGEGLWKWALLPPELVDYTHCYNDFWTQLVRWMVNQSDFLPGQNFSLRTDHVAYSPGETVNLMVFARGGSRGAAPAVNIIQPDGTPLTIGLSKGGGKQADFIGSFRPKVPGDYIATLTAGGKGGQVTAPFSVYERRQEDMNTSADPGLMNQVAEAGGGKSIALNDLRQFPAMLKATQASVRKKPQLQSVWDRWEVLLVILGLLGVEWLIRRRVGLV